MAIRKASYLALARNLTSPHSVSSPVGCNTDSQHPRLETGRKTKLRLFGERIEIW